MIRNARINSCLESSIRSREFGRSLQDLRFLGDKIRRIYHAPEPPVPVPDGTGGILFDLK